MERDSGGRSPTALSIPSFFEPRQLKIFQKKAKKKEPQLVLFFKWSGRRGSNSRHPPWQGGILPLNYPRNSCFVFLLYMGKKKLQADNRKIFKICYNYFNFLHYEQIENERKTN